MACNFQISRDIGFQHNEAFLAKADSLIPEMHISIHKNFQIVRLQKDASKLGGYGAVRTGEVMKDMTFGRGDKVILDFLTHHVGRFAIDISSVGSPMDAPLYIHLRFAEVPFELACRSEDYDGWLSRSWIQEEFIHLDELPCRLELPRHCSFRYVEISVIDTSPKWKAVFAGPAVTAQSSADAGNFTPLHFADPSLQKIYDIGVKTLYDCMSDVFEDGPKRDRRLWLGDLHLQAQANYAAFRENRLVKRCLYLFAAMPTDEGRISADVFVHPRCVPDDTFLFDYSLFFISTLYDLMQNDPDMEVLQDLYPTARKQMDLSLSYVNDEGCYIPDPSYPVFIDWSNAFDKTACGQAVIIYALRQLISLTEMVHRDASEYQKVLEQMISYSRTHLYNKERGLFRSGNDEYSIASQVWMIQAEVLPPGESRELMRTCMKELFPVRGIATPYMYHYIADSMLKVGLKDEAIALIRNYWGKMADLGADTFWEAFDPDNPDYSPYGSPIISSYCHAWSCTPVLLLAPFAEK